MDEKEIMDLYMTEVKSNPPLSSEKTAELLKKYKENDDTEAFQMLVKHNLALAVKIAKQYESHCQSMSLLDLMQEGSLILMDAIERYDLNRGVKLSDYIGMMISRSLQRKIDEQDAIIRVSVNYRVASRRYNRYIEDSVKKTGKEPSIKEVASSTKFSEKQVRKIKRLQLFQPKSLDRIILDSQEEKQTTLYDKVKTENDEFENFIQNQDNIVLLRALADFLTKEEYYTLYYRVICKNKKSLEKIGEELGGLKSETIRIRQKRIMEKIEFLLPKIQRQRIKNNGLTNIDTRELVPLEPKERLALYYLKHNIGEVPYYIIYTQMCNMENDNFLYYQSKFPDQKEEIKRCQQEIPNFMKEFFTPVMVDKLYEMERKNQTICEILELDIKPQSKKIESNKIADLALFNKEKPLDIAQAEGKKCISYTKKL